MAAAIHATLKGSNSNSYVTLNEADLYFETAPEESNWDDKTDDAKRRALISACRWIDSLNFYGSRCDEDQALKWPRQNYEVDNVELTSDEIPKSIKYAQYELARKLANDTDAMTGNKGTDFWTGIPQSVGNIKFTDMTGFTLSAYVLITNI